MDLLNCTPSLFESLLRGAPPSASVRHLVLGGEAFPVELRVEHCRQPRRAKITNLYGPTETTIDAIGFDVEGREAGPVRPDRASAAELRASMCWMVDWSLCLLG